MTALGERYSHLVPICGSNRTREYTTFFVLKIFIYLTKGRKEKSEGGRKEAWSRVLTLMAFRSCLEIA